MGFEVNLGISVLIPAIFIHILLAFIVYKNNTRSATNVIFGLLSLVTSIWLLVNHLALSTNFSSISLLLSRLSIFFAVPQILLFFLLSHTLPMEKLRLSRNKLFLVLSISIFVMIVTLSPYAFTDVMVVNGSVQPIPGPGMGVFSPFAITFSILAVYVLIKRLRHSTGIEKQQLKYMMYGILAMLGLLTITVLIPVIVLNTTAFVPFAPLYTLVFLGMTTYAIVKHRLLDIRLIVARAMAYTLLVGLVGAFFAISTVVATAFFLQDLTTTQQIFLYTTLTMIVAFTFQPLKRLIQDVTDKVFFKGRYDSSELLSSLTKIMATTLRLDDITKNILQKLLPDMRVGKGVFVLIDKGKVETIESAGFDEKQEFTGTDIISLLERKKVLFYEEENLKSIKNIMRRLDATVSVPLEVKEGELGVLLLGHKLSGEIYTDQDIKLLQILSPEISIAIQNAKAYEEIRRFNITLQKEIQKATVDLKFANESLKELDETKDEFVSVVSHELRTPMTAVKSYVWLALNGKAGPLNDKMRSYLEKVYQSSERLIDLINDVLDVSHIETGRINLDIQPISLLKVADDVVTTLAARADEQKIKLILEKDTHVPMVLVDSMKLNEIFVNLIGNALKFTKPGGSITVSFAKKENVVETSVTDTGIGISQTDLKKLFTKFGRIYKSYSTIAQSTGSGLGLYITKNYIDKMNGKIWVNSESGKGTTFTFAFPIAKDQKIKQPHVTKKHETISGHIGSEKS